MSFDNFKKKHAKDEEEARVFLEYELYMREHNPTIKEAWDQYQTLLQLMFDKNNPNFVEHKEQERKKKMEKEMEELRIMLDMHRIDDD